MKKILIPFGFLSAISVISYLYFSSQNNQSRPLISPLTDLKLTLEERLPTVTPINKPSSPPEKAKVTTKPLVLGTSKDQNLPEFLAESVAGVDLTSGRTMVTKNEKERRQIASLGKVMTAIVTLEHSSLNDLITINEEAPKIGESMMGLSAGEKLTVKELLYGLLLVSANDAAEALALGITNGDRQLFINWMNEKVKELKLTETYFANPSGLDEDQKQSTYSTAYDLLIISKYSLENFPVFREIVKTQEITLEKNYRRKAYELINAINMTNGIPGVAGVKTGYTDQAGYCLITLAKRDSHEVLGVLLGSRDTRVDARNLHDYAFKKINRQENQ